MALGRSGKTFMTVLGRAPPTVFSVDGDGGGGKCPPLEGSRCHSPDWLRAVLLAHTQEHLRGAPRPVHKPFGRSYESHCAPTPSLARVPCPAAWQALAW